MTIHNPITTLRVKMPQPHTRSTFDRNFSAAASSSSPIVAFTDSSHAPERGSAATACGAHARSTKGNAKRSEEHTSELQSQSNLVCRLLLEKKKTIEGICGVS